MNNKRIVECEINRAYVKGRMEDGRSGGLEVEYLPDQSKYGPARGQKKRRCVLHLKFL